jgi:BirA family transcriptional regulator, biotin operon repressor / biotin---[acetyl-CoA-carboxylase] ligase
MQITVLNFDTLDSTNTEALKQARQGADEGLCIVAKQQTAGRGRHGRTWVSEKDAGLYFSIVLRPKIEMQYLPLITLMAGVAVHHALEEVGLRPDIKWVNDILVDGKKICGILAETTETKEGLAVIVGIGINIKSTNLPPELRETATSIEEHERVSGRTEFPVHLLTRNLVFFYDVLQSLYGPASIIEEWRKRSTYFSGKTVSVDLGDRNVIGVTDGLEANGSLRVRKADGEVEIVHAGDVTRLRTPKSADSNVT